MGTEGTDVVGHCAADAHAQPSQVIEDMTEKDKPAPSEAIAAVEGTPVGTPDTLAVSESTDTVEVIEESPVKEVPVSEEDAGENASEKTEADVAGVTEKTEVLENEDIVQEESETVQENPAAACPAVETAEPEVPPPVVVDEGEKENITLPKEDSAENANLTIPANPSPSESNDEPSAVEVSAASDPVHKHGFPLNELYTISLDFYRRNKENLVTMGYGDKVQLVALWKQVTAGTFNPSKCPDVGYFDVIGNDRRKAWQQLGEMKADVAKEKFCELLEGNCPEYVTFVKEKRAALDAEIERKRLEEEERKRKEEEERLRKEEEERLRKEEEERLRKEKEEEERKRREEEERIRKEEEERIRKEEEERIRQEEEERIKRENEEKTTAAAEAAAAAKAEEVEGATDTQDNDTSESAAANAGTEPQTPETVQDLTSAIATTPESATTTPTLAPASLWTRPKLQEFINHVRGDVSSVLVVGRGETVTVRVPTHDNGSCLFWEFATEFYDVGFGVYFEWSASKSSSISVNVNESDNEDDDTPDESDGNASNDTTTEESTENIVVVEKPRMDEVVAVLRRNSHEEVIVGSHTYPGQGTYLLKFDNSYSLLRSKTLYYRVYYTK